MAALPRRLSGRLLRGAAAAPGARPGRRGCRTPRLPRRPAAGPARPWPTADPAPPRPSAGWERVRPVALAASFGLLLLVGVAAPSAARPGLGPRGWAPGDLPLHLSSAAVTAALWVAYLLGGLAVARRSGRRCAAARDRLPRGGAWLALRGWGWPLALAALALLTSPFGSADHTNYAAYGRIAAQGGDPYVVPPVTWHGGTDPVTSAVEPPWTRTPSIYGPFATLVQTLTSLARRRQPAPDGVGRPGGGRGLAWLAGALAAAAGGAESPAGAASRRRALDRQPGRLRRRRSSAPTWTCWPPRWPWPRSCWPPDGPGSRGCCSGRR